MLALMIFLCLSPLRFHSCDSATNTWLEYVIAVSLLCLLLKLHNNNKDSLIWPANTSYREMKTQQPLISIYLIYSKAPEALKLV